MQTQLGIKINMNKLLVNATKKNWLIIYSILNNKETRTTINNELFERIRFTHKLFDLNECSFQKLERIIDHLKCCELGDLLMGCGCIIQNVQNVENAQNVSYVSFDQKKIDDILETSLKIMNELGINKRLIDIVWFTTDY